MKTTLALILTLSSLFPTPGFAAETPGAKPILCAMALGDNFPRHLQGNRRLVPPVLRALGVDSEDALARASATLAMGEWLAQGNEIDSSRFRSLVSAALNGSLDPLSAPEWQDYQSWIQERVQESAETGILARVRHETAYLELEGGSQKPTRPLNPTAKATAFDYTFETAFLDSLRQMRASDRLEALRLSVKAMPDSLKLTHSEVASILDIVPLRQQRAAFALLSNRILTSMGLYPPAFRRQAIECLSADVQTGFSNLGGPAGQAPPTGAPEVIRTFDLLNAILGGKTNSI